MIKREKNVTLEREGSKWALVKRARESSGRELLVLDAEPSGIVNVGTVIGRDFWSLRGVIYSTSVTLSADELERLVEARSKPRGRKPGRGDAGSRET